MNWNRILTFTLNGFFLTISICGVLAVILAGIILLSQQHRSALDQWQNSVLQQSSGSTATYYSHLLKMIVMEEQVNIDSLLTTIKNNEHLNDVRIVPTDKITNYILATCEVNNDRSIFSQVPVCYEISDGHFRIYHELRSIGYNVGYLMKELEIPKIGFWDHKTVIVNLFVVPFVFIVFSCLILFFIRLYLILPIQILTNSAIRENNVSAQSKKCRVKEINFLSDEIDHALTAIQEYHALEKAREHEIKLGQYSTRVAHDIRSPLAALQMITTDLKELSEDKRLLIRSAVQRIEDITNDLSSKKKSIKDAHPVAFTDSASTNHDGSQTHVQLLSAVIDNLISEKRTQYRNQNNINIYSEFNTNSYGLFANMNLKEFKRILSNLINNAVEALDGKGRVVVRACNELPADHEVLDNIKITITDTGKGIPAEVLPQLFHRGASFGKSDGQGLGLHLALKTVREWGGNVTITSKPGQGTTVTLTLPKAATPKWFLPELVIDPANEIPFLGNESLIDDHEQQNNDSQLTTHDLRIAILDDDESIHQIWNKRFAEIGLSQKAMIHFKEPQSMIDWYLSQTDQVSTSAHGSRGGPPLAGQFKSTKHNSLFLFDYELLGSQRTGLDVIEQLNLGQQAILVTSHYEDMNIQNRCITLGVRMIPKNLAGIVPIRRAYVPTCVNKSILILNDDEALLLVLKITCKKQGHVVFTARNVTDAKNILATHNIDLVLSDINLGIGQPDGFELIDHVRTKDKRLPFFFVSGYTDNATKERATKSGATGYLNIPFDQKHLVSLINAKQ